jgi:hypothetical protein
MGRRRFVVLVGVIQEITVKDKSACHLRVHEPGQLPDLPGLVTNHSPGLASVAARKLKCMLKQVANHDLDSQTVSVIHRKGPIHQWLQFAGKPGRF